MSRYLFWHKLQITELKKCFIKQLSKFLCFVLAIFTLGEEFIFKLISSHHDQPPSEITRKMLYCINEGEALVTRLETIVKIV